MIERLEKIKAKRGDIEVMFTDPESSGGPFAVTGINVKVAEKYDYPEEFGMPEGFTFVDISGW